MAKIKVIPTLNANEDTEKSDHSYMAGRNGKWYSYPGKEFDNFL